MNPPTAAPTIIPAFCGGEKSAVYQPDKRIKFPAILHCQAVGARSLTLPYRRAGRAAAIAVTVAITAVAVTVAITTVAVTVAITAIAATVATTGIAARRSRSDL